MKVKFKVSLVHLGTKPYIQSVVKFWKYQKEKSEVCVCVCSFSTKGEKELECVPFDGNNWLLNHDLVESTAFSDIDMFYEYNKPSQQNHFPYPEKEKKKLLVVTWWLRVLWLYKRFGVQISFLSNILWYFPPANLVFHLSRSPAFLKIDQLNSVSMGQKPSPSFDMQSMKIWEHFNKI